MHVPLLITVLARMVDCYNRSWRSAQLTRMLGSSSYLNSAAVKMGRIDKIVVNNFKSYAGRQTARSSTMSLCFCNSAADCSFRALQGSKQLVHLLRASLAL